MVLRKALDVLHAINRVHCHWMRQAAGILLGMMLIVAMSQVVFRYLLGSSITWSEEVSKSMMVWSVFLVAPWAYRYGANVSIDFLRRGFSPRFRAIVETLIHIVVLWLLGRLFWESLFFVDRGWTITAASLPVHMAWIYMITPVSFAALLLVGFELGLRQVHVVLIPGVPLAPLEPDEPA